MVASEHGKRVSPICYESLGCESLHWYDAKFALVWVELVLRVAFRFFSPPLAECLRMAGAMRLPFSLIKSASRFFANRFFVRLPRGWLLTLLLLLLFPWCAVLMVFMTGRPAVSPTSAASALLPSADGSVAAGERPLLEGPWGRLSAQRLVLSPSLEMIETVDRFTHAPVDQMPVVRWHFNGQTQREIATLFQAAGVPSEIGERMLAGAQPNEAGDGWVLRPEINWLLRMPPETRAALYVELARYPENFEIDHAFRFAGDSLSDWFGDNSGLSPQTLALVRPMIYQRNGYLFFAGMTLATPKIADQEERLRLLRAVSRESTLLVRLHVDHQSDVEELVRYWGEGGRSEEVRPLLESLAARPGGGSIDIAQLLPTFARNRLYTYALPSTENISSGRDCHWTSLNFFNDPPNDYFAEGDSYLTGIRNGYVRTTEQELALGDLVLIFEGDKLFHTCVHVAGDVVFSKNGSKCSRPWMLMWKQDAINFYPKVEQPSLLYFKRRVS